MIVQIFIFFLYMVNWFEKAKEILKNKDCGCNEAFTTLFEDFFDVLMVNISHVYSFTNYVINLIFTLL